MITREDISKFLTDHKADAKENVIADFTSYALSKGITIDKLAKLIADLRSYKEWIWGE